MLSYRHAFHAGNHADVVKHLALVLTLDYYQQKAKPFCYIDTHAGAGLYQMTSQEAQKTREYEQGIAAVLQAPNPPVALQPYLALIRELNPNKPLKLYPGSPWLAARLLRANDSLHLFELHPTDAQRLNQNFRQDKRVQVHKEDGLKGLLKLLPPSMRRSVILMDPSYELKTDYTDVIKTLVQAHKRFATGTYMLWYPVIQRQRVESMAKALQTSAIPDILQVEYSPLADSEGIGMTGSGLFIINPPWVLAEQMQTLLPWLLTTTGTSSGHFRIQTLTPEKTAKG